MNSKVFDLKCHTLDNCQIVSKYMHLLRFILPLYFVGQALKILSDMTKANFKIRHLTDIKAENPLLERVSGPDYYRDADWTVLN